LPEAEKYSGKTQPFDSISRRWPLVGDMAN